MPNMSDSLSLLRQYDVSLTRKIFQDQETRGYNVMAQVISEQSQSKISTDTCDSYSVLYRKEALLFIYFMSAILENHSHPRGN